MNDFDHTRINELMHSRLRLAIMAALVTVEHAEFTYLRDKINATDGNLGARLRRLEEAGYVSLEKRFVDRKPRTDCELTDAGRAAFGRYKEQLGLLVATPSPLWGQTK